MPKLYIEEYHRALIGKSVFIACREGILRDHFADIVADIKFLNRQGVHTALFHNMSNRFANQKHFRQLEARLTGTRIVRVPSEVDFYSRVLDCEERVAKLIFLERKYLIDQQGQRINALTTRSARNSIEDFGDLIANANFKGVLDRICQKIENGHCERVHILPAGKNTIKHELFTIEGSGTLIANDFTEIFKQLDSDEEAKVVFGILGIYRHEGFLKPRSSVYILENRENFYVTKIDGIIVGCVEKKIIDAQTIELGALAISTKFRNQRVGVFTVNAFMEAMHQQGFCRFISLSNNPKLQALYRALGFAQDSSLQYRGRQKQSPGVKMFLKEIG
jgi:N-acetylglutamate synthase-like GNAT family acetyltransferase